MKRMLNLTFVEIKILCCGHMLSMILMNKKLLIFFYEKELQKQKVVKYMLNRKNVIICLIAGYI